MIYKTILVIHIICGTLALLGGAVSMITRKGNNAHRKSGRLFVITMIITAVSAVILSFIKPNMFLLAIGFFTLYLTLSGWIWVMKIPQQLRLKLNKLIGFFGLASGLFLLEKGIYGFKSFQVVLLVFAGIQILMSVGDLVKKHHPRQNILNHIPKIGGAYIAAITAFLVVNVEFLPPYIVWLGPTVVGSVLITVAIRRRVKV